MTEFFPFMYKKKEKKEEPLPLFIEEAQYHDLLQENKDEEPYIISIEIL